MKKLILPLLPVIFALFFSGKPAQKTNCLSSLYIVNYSSIPVYRVDVYNYSTDETQIYMYPGQIFHEAVGTRFRVTYFFDRNATGAIQVDSNLPDPFFNQSSDYIEFLSSCNNHEVWLIN